MDICGTDFYSHAQTNACLGEGQLIYPLLELVGVGLCKNSLDVDYTTFCFLSLFSD